MKNSRIASFAPVSHASARVLILGSMPGAKSLAAGQYYAHPRNCFWLIMQHLTGLNPQSSYPLRLEGLKSAGIALWDVMHSCERTGSLDAGICPGSIVANDFRSFFRRHPDVCLVCFNGAVAEQCFRKHVLPGLDLPEISLVRLPSTSPARTLPVEEKVQAWIASGILPLIDRSLQ